LYLFPGELRTGVSLQDTYLSDFLKSLGVICDLFSRFLLPDLTSADCESIFSWFETPCWGFRQKSFFCFNRSRIWLPRHRDKSFLISPLYLLSAARVHVNLPTSAARSPQWLPLLCPWSRFEFPLVDRVFRPSNWPAFFITLTFVGPGNVFNCFFRSPFFLGDCLILAVSAGCGSRAAFL